MTKEETYDYFIDLITDTNGGKAVKLDNLMKENLSYFVERYYDTPQWDFMKKQVETLIKKGDLLGLCLYIFKAVQKYRKTLYNDFKRNNN